MVRLVGIEHEEHVERSQMNMKDKAAEVAERVSYYSTFLKVRASV